MQLNQNIFRANDIRGIAYEDLTEEVVESLVSLEKKMLDHEIEFAHNPVGPDPNDPLADYPEVQLPPK